MKRMLPGISLMLSMIFVMICGGSQANNTPYHVVSKAVLQSAYSNWQTEGDYFDITPDSIFRETGVRVYKCKENFETVIKYNDTIIPIGIGFGGSGVTDIETCDFDGDGRKELIYSYSWGSGLHRSNIAIFNFVTLYETRLEYLNLNSDTMLEKQSDTQFVVYDAELAGDSDGLFVNVKQGSKLAEISCEDGQPMIARCGNSTSEVKPTARQ